MSGWSALYERPRALARDWAHQRIYSCHSYRRLREAPVVPIILEEAAALAQFFPLCWQRTADGPVLVALTGLLAEEHGHYPPGRAALPLALQAYPFVVPDMADLEQGLLMVDEAIADRPTDIGAPIMLDTGRMSAGALQRARIAIEVGRSLEATEALGRELLGAGLLDPWPLAFDLGASGAINRRDLAVIAAPRLNDPALFGIVERCGAGAGLFLGLHRLSLFRINALLAMARARRPQQPDLAAFGIAS